MKKLALILDSAAGQCHNEIEDCYLVPLTVIEKKGSELIEYDDLKTITTEQVYEKIKEGKELSTAQMKLGTAMILAEDLLEEYENVFVFCLSEALTGAINTWKQIKEEIGSDKLHIFNTHEVGYGLMIQAQKAKELFLKKKKSPEQIQQWIEESWNINRRGFLIVNNLDALIKGGRISAFKGKIAKLLNLRLSIISKDSLEFFGKSQSLEKLVDMTLTQLDKENNFTKKGLEKLVFGFNISEDNFKEYNEFKQICFKWLKDHNVEYDEKSIQEKHIPSVIAVHTGVNSFWLWTLAKES